MASNINILKKWLSGTPLYKPVKFLAAIFGRSTYSMPHYKPVKAERYLCQAVAKLGLLSEGERSAELFYSYFSEMWGDGYESQLTRQYETYLPLIQSRSNNPFLDIGCGVGEFIAFLSQNGMNAQGIDLNEEEVARAVKRGLGIHSANCAYTSAET